MQKIRDLCKSLIDLGNSKAFSRIFNPLFETRLVSQVIWDCLDGNRKSTLLRVDKGSNSLHRLYSLAIGLPCEKEVQAKEIGHLPTIRIVGLIHHFRRWRGPV